MVKTMLPNTASSPNASSIRSTILQHVTAYRVFCCISGIYGAQSQSGPPFLLQRNPNSVTSHKIGLFASMAVRTTNQQEHKCLFLLGGLQSCPDNSPPNNNFRYWKCHKKLDEMKLIF
jgi:hypothetical protein